MGMEMRDAARLRGVCAIIYGGSREEAESSDTPPTVHTASYHITPLAGTPGLISAALFRFLVQHLSIFDPASFFDFRSRSTFCCFGR